MLAAFRRYSSLVYNCFMEEGRIERLKKMLYRPKEAFREKKRFELHPHASPGVSTWEEGSDQKNLSEDKKISLKQSMPFWKKFFIFSVLFFVVAAAIAVLVFFSGGNTVSTHNVDILVSGPVATKAGEKVELELLIENNNAVALESADLLIEYPDGTTQAENQREKLTRTRKSLGAISSGAVIKEPLRVVLFGQEGDEKTFRISLEYRVSDSNAIFVKEKEYRVRISSSATTLSIETVSETISGQQFSMRVTIASNADTVTKDLVLSIEYPFGFIFRSAEPRPVNGKNIWVIGDLPARGKRTIVIEGSLNGQDGEKKVFRASLGERLKTDEEALGVAYNTVLTEITIARPFLSVLLFLNGAATEEYVAESGETIDAHISWTNNLPTRIVDAKIEIKLVGVVDELSIDPRNGFYDSRTKTIVWDKNSLPELASIDSGGEGEAILRFEILPLISPGSSLLKNPTVTLAVTTSGNRVSETGVPDRIENMIERKIKVTSEAVFTPRAVYSVGPFQNTGPLPPEVGQETTYTVLWTAINSSNHISRTSVKAALPPYVRWIGATSPSSETISFNEVSREITWNVGRLEAGSGITLPPREVAFQIGFTPSVSQLNQTPTILGESTFSGVDEFTQAVVRIVGKALSIALNTDPGYVFSYGKVVEQKSGQ